MIAKHKYLVFFILTCITIIVVLSVWYTGKINRFESEIADQVNISDSLIAENLFLSQLSGVDDNYITGNYDTAKEEYARILRDLDTTHPLFASVKMRLKRIQAIEDVNVNEITTQDLEVLQLALMNRNEIIEILNGTLDSLSVQHVTERESLLTQIKLKNQEVKDKDVQLNRKEKIQVISFKSPKGKVIHYLGEVKEGNANGGGVGIWNTGSMYKGEWKDNKRHGQGRYEWADGDVYVGSYVDDIREGEGTYNWLSGEKYQGEWSRDKRNGVGKLYDKDGNLQYEGMWVDDKIVN